jgi:hypothetical protein
MTPSASAEDACSVCGTKRVNHGGSDHRFFVIYRVGSWRTLISEVRYRSSVRHRQLKP